MIDVHMVVTKGEREDWRADALASCEAQGVTVRVVESVGTASASRTAALASVPDGCEYATWIDPDDLALPGAFDALREVVESGARPGLIFTDERMVDANGNTLGDQPASRGVTLATIASHPMTAHHLTAIRVDLLPRLLPLMRQRDAGAEWIAAAGAAKLGGFLRIPRVLYAWRVRAGSARALPLLSADTLSTMIAGL